MEEYGTKYHINKDFTYEDINNKLIRRFNKCKVIYIQIILLKIQKENLWIDEAINEKYIILFKFMQQYFCAAVLLRRII